jgi:hypothetical protein
MSTLLSDIDEDLTPAFPPDDAGPSAGKSNLADLLTCYTPSSANGATVSREFLGIQKVFLDLPEKRCDAA